MTMKVIQDPETLQRLAVARLWASRRWPYLNSILHSLIPVVVETGSLSPDGTLAVDEQLRLYVEPPALARWSIPQAGSVLIHEAMHILRRHGARRGVRNPELWNLAGDAEINDDLTDGAYELPDGGGIQPSHFGQPVGKTAEEYYASTPKTSSKPRIGHGACGGCAQKSPSKPGDGQSDQPEDSAPGEAPAGRTPSEVETAVRGALTAMQDAKGRGSLPSGLARHLEDPDAQSTVPWEQRLLMRVRGGAAMRAGAVEHRYHRPSRRQAGIGYGAGFPVLPHPVAPIPRVTVAFDTSASMRQEDLARGLVETVSIMRSLGIEVTFITCDAKVHESAKVRTMRDLLPLLKGGGGTSFIPVFDHIAKSKQPPDVLVFVTDGDGDAPAAPPPYRTIWLLVREGRPPAAWGEAIRC